MSVLMEHLSHHARHMLVCVFGAVVMAGGLAAAVMPVAIVGAVVCAAGCLSMIRMVVTGHRD